ncbi:hypothetical protein [Streptacidiphilus rugosus]|uniref:hypothetical protein n=1 Tax=Streptacidiphilus rugosus TaxID=405783 RepID=UPI0005623CEE|nr:hypothetical protein [Streptacidiphilus rugosus]
MGALRIIVICVVLYLVTGQCAWALYGAIKDGRPGWLFKGFRSAIEERMPDGVSGLPLAVFLWVFIAVFWPFPLSITALDDLHHWRKQRRSGRQPTGKSPVRPTDSTRSA